MTTASGSAGPVQVYRARRWRAVTGSLIAIVFGTWAFVSGPTPAVVAAALALAAAPVFVVVALRTQISFSAERIVVRDLRHERSVPCDGVEVTAQRIAGGWLRTGPILVFAGSEDDAPIVLALSPFSVADRESILAEVGLDSFDGT